MNLDPVEQDEINYANAECAQAALDARVDEATTEALTSMTEVELWNALTEIDVNGKALAGSPEDHFHSLLIWVRETAQKEQAKGALPRSPIEKALYGMVWSSHRRFEIEGNVE